MAQFDARKYHNVPQWQSAQEILEWIASLDDDPETYQKNIHIFNYAVNDLIECGADAVDPLIDRMLDESSNRWMRWAGTWALRDIGDRRAVEPLWRVFSDNNRDKGIRYDAMEALSIFQDKRIFDEIVRLFNEQDTLAIICMGNLGDERAITLLAPLLDEEEKLIRDIV